MTCLTSLVRTVRPAAAWPLLLLLPVVAACAQKSGPERVEELRARYDVRLNGFVVREVPGAATLPEEAPLAEATPGPSPAASPGSPAGDGAVPPVQPNDLTGAKRDVVLDLLVHHDAPEALPGITVDISQAGPDEVEKAHFRAWLDTSRIARGQSAQLSHVLEQIDFTAGDRFAVEVVSPVPPEQRGEYREFQPE